jgi:hypothetical protein
MHEDGPSKRVAFLWDISLTHATRRFRERDNYGDRKSPSDGTLCRGAQASRSVGPDFEVVQFPRSQAPANSCGAAQSRFGLEPARPETVGRVLQDWTSRVATS